jgi:hypothetical protein
MSPVPVDSFASPSNSNFAVLRLQDDGSSWVDYKIKAQMAMGARGLIRHVDGTAIKPKAFELESGVPVTKPGKLATDEEIDAKERRLDEFEQKEYMAWHIMLSTVSPHLVGMVNGKTSSQMWTKIKKDATTKSQLHKVDTRCRLMMMRCDDKSDIRSHPNMMVRIWDELLGMGETVSSNDLATFIMSSLPESYCPLLSLIIHATSIAEKTLELNEIMRIVLKEAQQRSISKHSRSSTESAMLAGNNLGKSQCGKGKGKGNPNQSKSDRKCDNCQHTNHNTPDCYQKGGTKRGQAPWQKNKLAPTYSASYAHRTMLTSQKKSRSLTQHAIRSWTAARPCISAQITTCSRHSDRSCPSQSKRLTAERLWP